MKIKSTVKRYSKQPSTQIGAMALLLAPQIMPDVDWPAVIDAVKVLWVQTPIIVAGIAGLGVWNFLKDDDKE